MQTSRAGLRRIAAVVALVAIGALPSRLLAQQRPDVIRGRVVGPDTLPVANAQVVVIDTIAKTPPRPTRTDAKGTYSITVENGSGTYMVAATMLGYAPQRRVVKRGADGAIPAVDFKLAQVAAQLSGVRTVGERPRVARSDASADNSTGGQTSFVNLNNGLVGDLTGDLTAALANVPGVTIIPSATGGLPTVSAFGVSGDQNGLLLNGMGFGGSIPRDGARVSVITSSYDPSRGGFAGIQTSVRLSAGSNYQTRSLHATLDAPTLQWTTPVARQLATRYDQQILSGTASGPIQLDRLFYSTTFQVQRRASDLTSLATADAASLSALKISPDSVSRLVSALGPAGIPLATAATPGQRENTEGRATLRIDWTPRAAAGSNNLNVPVGVILIGAQNATQDAYYAEFGGTVRNNDGAMISATSVPSFGGEARHRDGWAQVTAAKYLPKSILNETTVSLNGSIDRSEPYLDLPSARILVASTLPDGQSGLSTLQVGGNSQPRSESRLWQTELRNQSSWNTWDRRHSISLTLSGSEDGFSINQGAGFGSYVFNSLGDFATGIPASYSRTLTGRQSSGHGFTGAIGLGDTWLAHAPVQSTIGLPTTPPAQIQYGLRLEGNRFSDGPSYNPTVDSIFGLRTDHVPSTVALTPMVGFRMYFGKPFSGTNGLLFGPRGQLSGGVREYRGTIATRALDSYARQTGLPNGIQQLYCVGSATPVPDWRTFESSTAGIPTECANGAGSTALAHTTPPVALYGEDYRPLESWRPQLNVSYQIAGGLTFNGGATYTVNKNNPSIYDVNFNNAAKFPLASEGGRPIYVSPSSIVEGTGAEAWTESRVSPLFAHVAESRSDLRAETKTLSAGLSYFTFSLGGPGGNTWSLTTNYTYSDSREQFRGFTGTTDGDPTTVAWARTQQAKHVVVSNATIRLDRVGVFQLFSRIQSGAPFTPFVNGDINGDGYSNDRAFIFDPASTPDTSIANPMSRLLANAPGNTRACLTRQINTVAGRNSCMGPWSFTNLSLSFAPDAYRFKMGNRGGVSLFVNNILSGLDQAVHGSNKLHGWGQPAFPDATLLTVRGYDATAQRFRYAVNPQFGSTAVFRNTFRQPFMLTIDFRMDVSPDRETQFIHSLLTPKKGEGVKSYSEAQIKQKIMRGFNPIDQLIVVKDSLKLTDTQVDSMRKLGQKFLASRDSIAGQVAKFLVARNGDYGGGAVREVWHNAGIESYRVYLRTMKTLIGMFTPEQLERSKTLPQTLGIVQNFTTLQESDLPYLFRGAMATLP